MKKTTVKPNSRSVTPPRISRALTVAAVLTASTSFTLAANFTWSGATVGGATSNWSAGTNWDSTPVSGSSTSLVISEATGATGSSALVNDIAGNFLLNSMSLNGTGPGATLTGTTVISGGTLEFAANGGTNPTINLNALNTSGTGLYRINNNIILDNTVTFAGNGSGVANKFNFAGSFSGAGDIIKAGNSWLSLSGTNSSYSGNVTVNSGKLLFTGGNSSSTAWVSTGTLSIAAGATAGNSGGWGAFSALNGNGLLDGGGNRSFSLNYNGATTDTFTGTLQNVLFNKNGTGKLVITSTMAASNASAYLVWAGELETAGISGSQGWAQVSGGMLKFTGTSGNLWSGVSGYASQLLGGTLAIAPTGSGADVVVAGGTASAAGGMRLYSGTLLLDKGNNTSLTFVAGNSVTSASIVKFGDYNRQAVLKAAGGLDNLGNTEKLVVLASSPTYAPQLTSNMAPVGMIGQDTDANRSGDFLTYVGTGLASDAGFKRYDYSVSNPYADTNFASADNTKVESVTTAQSLNGTTNAVYALKNSSVITLNAGSKLTVGSTATSSSNAIILNGGSIVGSGTLSLMPSSGNTAYIYSSLENGTISTSLVLPSNLVITGPGVLTYNGATNLSTNSFVNSGATLDVALSRVTGSLYLGGGVLQTTGVLTKSLGTSAGSISLGSLPTGGGFAARGGNLTVNLGGNVTPSTLTWNTSQGTGGTANFLQDGASLLFGSQTADGEVIFQNNIDLGGNTANFSRLITVFDNPHSSTDRARITGVISSTSGNNQLVKDGAGTLVLDANNTYTGATIINSGKLAVNGSIASSIVTVNDGGVLGGTGTVGTATAVTVNAGGAIAPGADGAIGTLTIGTGAGSTVALVGTSGSLAELRIDLGATSCDLLAIQGDFNLNSSYDQLTLSILNTETLSENPYLIATYTGTLSGAFDNVVGLPAGMTYSLDYTHSGEIYLTASVPEPATWSMLVGGLGMLMGIQRWRKNRQGVR